MTTVIDLDAANWTEEEHFYLALLPQLRAPEWHGHNLDALWDSIVGGDINGIQPPFHIRITNVTSENIGNYLVRVKDLMVEARREGVEVDLEIG